MSGGSKKNSDLPVRLASAIVMVAVAGAALWLGGIWWTAFVALVAIGVFVEWSRLSFGMTASAVSRFVWLLVGLAYIGFACAVLVHLRSDDGGLYRQTANDGFVQVATLILIVAAVDVGAYFFGRAIGGPKIAPRISPSKTWAGLFGGTVGAFLILVGHLYFQVFWTYGDTSGFFNQLGDSLTSFLGLALISATVAQAGDFFESWMKRKAAVKDSSNMIPGHGGLFDRVDGLLAVCFLNGLSLLL